MKTLSRILFLTLIALLSGQPARAQKLWDHPLVKRFTSSTSDSTRSGSLLFLPVLGYSQETGLEFGATGIYNFYTDRADTGIFTSNLNSVVSFTTEKQVNLKLESDLWTTGNTYHYIAALRYKKYPFNFYGLGDQTRADDKQVLTQNFFQVNLEAEKKILPRYYAGLNVLFENFDYREEDGTDFTSPSLAGAGGGRYLAFGISQSYDSRNSNTETTKGFYARGKYAWAPDFWGGEHFTGSLLSVDLRGFLPLQRQLTLGFQGILETVLSDSTPFYLTPQLGNDEIMRGYYQGRYRDENYLAVQSELRYRLHPRIGLAAFLGAGSVYRNEIDLSKLKLAGGGGVRYFFDLEHHSSIRFDYAIGEKKAGEGRQGGFYLALGQAF